MSREEPKRPKLRSDPVVRVHIVLKEAVRGDEQSCRNALDEITGLGFSRINEKRLQRYGIISGDLRATRVETVKALPTVESISIDTEDNVLRP